jgi:hypothetical protein
MGRRLRCSSVTYRFRYAPSSASPARTALPAAHFDHNKIPRVSGTGHYKVGGPFACDMNTVAQKLQNLNFYNFLTPTEILEVFMGRNEKE